MPMPIKKYGYGIHAINNKHKLSGREYDNNPHSKDNKAGNIN